MSNNLGFVDMPSGFALVRTDDHWFWYHAETDRESAIHWDKWAVYRWAKEQFAQDNGRAELIGESE